MEMKNLYGITLMLVLVGMVIGVGVLALDKFATATKKTETIINESVTLAAGSVTLANNDVVTLLRFGNTTISTDATYIVGSYANLSADKTTLAISGVWTAGTYNASYTYLKDSVATTATEAGRSEVSAIATTWLGLIVTIIVLSLIIGLVVGSFGFGKQR